MPADPADEKTAPHEQTPQDGRTQIAMAQLDHAKRKREAGGYAVMGAVMSYGSTSRADGLFGKLSRAAFWFCVWFAIAAPVFLFWHVML